MTKLTRRQFGTVLGATGTTLALAGCASMTPSGPRVVVVGGGFGGATAAKYLRMMDPTLDVTLVEPERRFVTCPFSNLVLGGLKTMDQITHGYEALASRHGVRVVHQAATAIDSAGKTVTLADGSRLSYDRLVVSPGIDIRWNALAGYDEAAAERMPHAWKAGAQTVLLRRQLEAMPDGGLFVMSAPADPFRCPPGPYERVSMVAHYLKTAKPRSKILVLDSKETFSKQGLFTEGWRALYGGMVEWVALSKDGKVSRAMPGEMTLETEFGVKHRGAVVNVVPPQWAGAIARNSGLADQSGWCPIDPMTFESRLQKDIFVVGDATIAAPMPKSGFSANSQAKVAAFAIVAGFRGRPISAPSFANTCYSMVGTDYAISIAAVYRVSQGRLEAVPNSGGVSPTGAPPVFRRDEARYTEGWYQSITSDMFA